MADRLLPDTLVLVTSDGRVIEYEGNLRPGHDVLPELTRRQRQAVHSSADELSRRAKQLDRPLTERTESQGIRWLLSVDAEGGVEDLFIDPDPKPHDEETIRAPKKGKLTVGSPSVTLPADGLRFAAPDSNASRVSVRISGSTSRRDFILPPGEALDVHAASDLRQASVLGSEGDTVSYRAYG